MKLSKKKSIDFKDVNLLSTQPSVINSRDEISFNKNRIIAAPMSAIMGKSFVKNAILSGISLPIHRFNTIDEQIELLDIAIEQKKLINSNSIIWLAVGLKDYKKRIESSLTILRDNHIGILLDVANGFHEEVENVVKQINKYELPNLFTGNIHTIQGWKFLENINSKFIRVGIGNGAACSTTTQTGIGRGQITIIDEIFCDYGFGNAAIVSDGGIKTPGDAAKAFGAGAEYIMIGSMFSYAREAECNINGQNVFYGGASAFAKKLIGLPEKNIEGEAVAIQQDKIKSLDAIVSDICDGIKSCISYSGYTRIEDFIGNAVFETKQK